MPSPQVALHDEKPVHGECTQFCGHEGTFEHDSVSAAGPQGVPPCTAATMIDRARVTWPAPQVTEHADHAPQLLCSQCTGHGAFAGAQGRSSNVAEHEPPQLAGTRIVRARSCFPGPHCVSQPLHAPQSLRSQGVAQHELPQASVWLRFGQCVPQSCCACVTVRARVRVPAPMPHDAVHVPHAPQSETWQSTQQAWGLHACVSCRLCVQVPPHVEGVTTLR